MSYRQPRRLGEDLLKMFLQEIATDVTIEAGSRKMRAHKCILRSRCQYFAAILAGNFVTHAGNVISLPGYSYSAVHFGEHFILLNYYLFVCEFFETVND